MLQRKREERPSLLPLPSAAASGSGDDVAECTHNTAKFATGSVRVLLFRMLLPSAHYHGAECCLLAAAARARRRNCRHRGGLVADQWRDSTIPTGKHATDQTKGFAVHPPSPARTRAPPRTPPHPSFSHLPISLDCSLTPLVHVSVRLSCFHRASEKPGCSFFILFFSSLFSLRGSFQRR